MIDPTSIFQRTQSGRDEIYNKSHGLTQSERLVLIMIDGVTAHQKVREKLTSLTDERFERAMLTLHNKELVSEVFMPIEGQVADEIETEVVDRFLQQDPLDPVTIIFVDPEDQLGLLNRMPALTPTPKSVEPSSPPPTAASVEQEGPTVNAIAESTADPTSGIDTTFDELAELAELASTVEREVRARNQERAFRPVPAVEKAARPAVRMNHAIEHVIEPERSPLRSLHWGYWMIGLGIAFIGSFLLSQLTH
ncbi:hypothetical protein [Noviherbaspirillum sp.]|uniref:hypothetical protein n=1 Tax=Noviherbaspirillum sp. TaxID=1926288 RepID=UPI002B4676D6|nr:hypothetical protein [Noviherbaspirillum sp.]HJV83086.1 hypothetical protein [Noviherbaspirillum sp.]